MTTITHITRTSRDSAVHLEEEGGRLLSGKTAVVTGAPRSTGAAVALAAQGAGVVVHYRSRREAAEDTVAAIREDGVEAIALGADLSDSAAVAQLVAAAEAHFGGVDVLAKKLGPRGITANSIMSGPIASGFLDPEGDVVRGAPPGALDALAAGSPSGRLGQPGDIAAVAAFLATAEAGWVNGQTILVNNGAGV